MALPRSTVDEIFRLAAEKKGASEIGQALGVHRMQVLALLSRPPRKASSSSPGTPAFSKAPEAPASPPPLDEGPGGAAEEPLDRGPSGQQDAAASPGEETQSAASVLIGPDAYETRVVWTPADAANVQNPHLMIMGESGSGKTYATQCLVAELAQLGIPSIIFDYGQSFELDSLSRPFVKHCHPREHLIGEEGLSLNPLAVEREPKGPNGVAIRLADVFDAAFGLGDIQRKALIDAIIKAYGDVGIIPEDRATWAKQPPPMLSLRDAIDALAADRQHYANYKNAAGLSARLTTFFMLTSFRDDAQWSWDDLTADTTTKVHILQFRGLEGKTQRALVEMLLWHLFYHLKTLGQSPLRLFCILDEAHHLSFRENSPVTGLLREARKFGLGLLFASQQPEDFSPVAYSNSASKLIFQTADPTLKVSKYLVSKLANYDRPEELREAISRLKQGSAFFISRNRGHEVRVATFEERSTFWGSP
jgi:DNA phosphorothioation-dependent restriction protein DptH